MSNAQNVSWSKPKVGGAVYTAPLGTPTPTNATSELDTSTYKSLGYISEDGMENDNSPESDTLKAWGGDVVLVVTTERPDSFNFTLIESTNVNVLKSVYGDANVTGDLDTGIKVEVNSKPVESKVYVADTIMKDGVIKRIVIPNAQFKELAPIKYVDDDAVGYNVTIQAIPDELGNSHYEYIVKA